MALRIPLLAEQLEIGKHEVETGQVRIGKTIGEREVRIDVPLQRDDVDIRRVRIDRAVDQPVPTRHEGDVTIVSLHEEVAVVTRQLMLTEELHITTRRSEVHEPQQLTLRHEEARVIRTTQTDRPADDSATGERSNSIGPTTGR